MNTRLEELQARLGLPFELHFHELPSRDLCVAIEAELGRARVADFVDLFCKRVDRGRVKHDALLQLARDAAVQAETRIAQGRQAAEPAADPPAVFEDEASGSVWMQIRLFAKKALTPADYFDSFRLSAFRSRCGSDLVVLVANEEIARLLREEHSDVVQMAIIELKLGIDQVNYLVAPER